MKPKTKKPLMCTLDEKLFFVIKYWLMSAFQGLAIIIIVFLLGAVTAGELILLGILLFIVSLLVSRHFDKNISALAFKITKKLADYPKIKKLLIRNI